MTSRIRSFRQALGLAAVGSWNALAAADGPIAATSATPVPAHVQTVNTYCVGCHNDRAKTGGLSLAVARLSLCLGGGSVRRCCWCTWRSRLSPSLRGTGRSPGG